MLWHVPLSSSVFHKVTPTPCTRNLVADKLLNEADAFVKVQVLGLRSDEHPTSYGKDQDTFGYLTILKIHPYPTDTYPYHVNIMSVYIYDNHMPIIQIIRIVQWNCRLPQQGLKRFMQSIQSMRFHPGACARSDLATRYFPSFRCAMPRTRYALPRSGFSCRAAEQSWRNVGHVTLWQCEKNHLRLSNENLLPVTSLETSCDLFQLGFSCRRVYGCMQVLNSFKSVCSCDCLGLFL